MHAALRDRPGNSLCAAAEIFPILVFYICIRLFGSVLDTNISSKAKTPTTMAAPKRKQDKTSGYPVASKKPKFGKQLDKSKSAGKKDVDFKKSKKPVPKRTALSVESDSDEMEDDDVAREEIKDDGSEGEEEEVEEEEDGMDIDQASKENGDGCECS